MSRFLRPATLCLLTLASVMSACDDLPTNPDTGFSHLQITCFPAGVNVACTAILHGASTFGGAEDVTTRAAWLVSDPSLGQFARPGLFAPLSSGEVGLWAQYEKWESLEKPWFLVGPGTAARWLYFVAGSVYDASTNERLPGAEVRILDGYTAGAHTLANQHGYYQIERVLTGEVFTIVASKDGYSANTQSYHVDPPVGPNGNSPFLDFRLTRLP